MRCFHTDYKNKPQKPSVCLSNGDCNIMTLYSVGDNPYPTAFPYGNGTVLHFYQQQESSTTKTCTQSH